MNMQAPIRSTLPREQATRLVQALAEEPTTRGFSPRIDHVGGSSDEAWVSIRAPRDRRGVAIDAALRVAQKTLGDNFPPSAIGFTETKELPAPDGRGR